MAQAHTRPGIQGPITSAAPIENLQLDLLEPAGIASSIRSLSRCSEIGKNQDPSRIAAVAASQPNVGRRLKNRRGWIQYAREYIPSGAEGDVRAVLEIQAANKDVALKGSASKKSQCCVVVRSNRGAGGMRSGAAVAVRFGSVIDPGRTCSARTNVVGKESSGNGSEHVIQWRFVQPIDRGLPAKIPCGALDAERILKGRAVGYDRRRTIGPTRRATPVGPDDH